MVTKVLFVLVVMTYTVGCEARRPPDKATPAALNAAGFERARRAAEEDAREAEQQSNMLRARTQNPPSSSAPLKKKGD